MIADQELDVARMKELRESQKLTLTQAAERGGMSVSRWCDIEKGGRSNITIETLSIIAKVLGCDARDLITGPVRRPKRGG